MHTHRCDLKSVCGALKSTPALILVKTGKVLSVTSGAEQTNTLFLLEVFGNIFLQLIFYMLMILIRSRLHGRELKPFSCV